MSFDGASHDPNERPSRRRVDANVGVGSGLESGSEHFLFAERTEQNERLIRAAAGESFGELQAVDLARFVRGEHCVVSLVAKSCQAVGDTVRFFDPHLYRAVMGESFRQPSAGAMSAGDEEQPQTRRKRSGGNDRVRRAMIGEHRAHAGNDGVGAPLEILIWP